MFYWDHLCLSSYSWVVMTFYDYSIWQNIHIFCHYSGVPPAFSCSHKHVCGHTQIITKQGWHRGQVCLFTVVLPLCAWVCVGCVVLSIHCVVGDKQLTSVTPLLTRAELHREEGDAERAGETRMEEVERWRNCRKRESKEERKLRELEKQTCKERQRSRELCCSFVWHVQAGLGLFLKRLCLFEWFPVCVFPLPHLKASVRSHSINIWLETSLVLPLVLSVHVCLHVGKYSHAGALKHVHGCVCTYSNILGRLLL